MHTKAWPHNACLDFLCVLCGRCYEQHNAAISLFGDDGENIGDVCPDCAKLGPKGAAERARQHAAELRKHADYLDALAERLPSVRSWATVRQLRRVERQFERQYAGGGIIGWWRVLAGDLENLKRRVLAILDRRPPISF